MHMHMHTLMQTSPSATCTLMHMLLPTHCRTRGVEADVQVHERRAGRRGRTLAAPLLRHVVGRQQLESVPHRRVAHHGLHGDEFFPYMQ